MVGVVLVPHIFLRLPGVQNSINDNQFLKDSPVQLSVSQGDPKQCQSSKTINFQETVNCCVVAPAFSVTGQSQKKDVRPFQPNVQIKSVKGVSCVNHQKFVSLLQLSEMPFMLSKIHLWEAVCKNFGRSGSLWVQIQGVHTKGRLLSTLPSKTPLVKVTGHSQSLCGSGQKQEPKTPYRP